MDTTQPQKSAKKKFNLKKSFLRIFSFPINPYKQFHRLLAVWLVLFAGVAVFHIYLFRNIENLDISKGDTISATPPPKVDDTKLEAVISRYTNKETTRTNAPTLVPPVEDPGK